MKAKIAKLVSYINGARSYRSIPAQLFDLASHKLKINIDFRDYYRFEFYKNQLDWREKERYVAVDGSRYWPFANNAFKYTVTLTDKYIQKNLLLGFDLPTPALLGIVGKNREIETCQQFENLIDGINTDFVIKPISGAGGKHILVVSRGDDGLQLGDQCVDAGSLWRQVQSSFSRGLLIEERAVNDEAIAKLCPSCLNTFRVVTIADSDGRIHICGVSLKLGRIGNLVDNNGFKNIQLNLRDDGSVYGVYDFLTEQRIVHHPDTGFDLAGHTVPKLDEIKSLAVRAAKKFSYLGVIGWDIASTTRGPVIIEGNCIFGCSSLQRDRPGIISDELAEDLPQYSWSSRWDKSHLYPGYHR